MTGNVMSGIIWMMVAGSRSSSMYLCSSQEASHTAAFRADAETRGKPHEHAFLLAGNYDQKLRDRTVRAGRTARIRMDPEGRMRRSLRPLHTKSCCPLVLSYRPRCDPRGHPTLTFYDHAMNGDVKIQTHLEAPALLRRTFGNVFW